MNYLPHKLNLKLNPWLEKKQWSTVKPQPSSKANLARLGGEMSTELSSFFLKSHSGIMNNHLTNSGGLQMTAWAIRQCRAGENLKMSKCPLQVLIPTSKGGGTSCGLCSPLDCLHSEWTLQHHPSPFLFICLSIPPPRPQPFIKNCLKCPTTSTGTRLLALLVPLVPWI